MTRPNAYILRDVELDGIRTDVALQDGSIASIDAREVRGASQIDAHGGALIPGLIDHHIHLFATAAWLDSVNLGDVHSKDALAAKLRDAAAGRSRDAWIRAVNYDDTGLGLLSREDLDRAGVPNPIRVQDRTGALWVLNTPALDLVGGDARCVEHDAKGEVTGRIWRGDAWLRTRIKSDPPSLAPLSRELASYGVTGVTDTSATNGPEEARLLARARTRGGLLQTLCLMGGADIPTAPEYQIGPLKILPDERDLPELEDVVARMRQARDQQRRVAVHCVTAGELALALAAFETVGAMRGDRLEHGGAIPEGLIADIGGLGLTVVTQPNFIYDRGDRYAQTLDRDELPDLYRLKSLLDAGIHVAAGSDAPYGGFNPWRAIAAAVDRTSKGGAVLGESERIGARAALGLYLGAPDDPGGAERKVTVDAPADLCLLMTPLAVALAEPQSASVAATFARGELIYRA